MTGGAPGSLEDFIGLCEEAIAEAERLVTVYTDKGQELMAGNARMMLGLLSGWHSAAQADGLADLPAGSGLGISRGFSEFDWGSEGDELARLAYAVEKAGRKVALERDAS